MNPEQLDPIIDALDQAIQCLQDAHGLTHDLNLDTEAGHLYSLIKMVQTSRSIVFEMIGKEVENADKENPR